MAIRIRYTLDLNLARAAKRSFCATGGGKFVSRWMGLGQDRDQGGGSLKVKWDTSVRGWGTTEMWYLVSVCFC